MMQADVKLDTLGYFCPMPIILTSKKIKELTTGQVLESVSARGDGYALSFRGGAGSRTMS